MYSQVRDPPKLNSDNGSANALVEENDNGIPVGDFSLSSLLELDFEPFSDLQEEKRNPLLGLKIHRWNHMTHSESECHLQKVTLFVYEV